MAKRTSSKYDGLSLKDSRLQFEAACAQQNARRAQERAEARATVRDCAVTTMYAFGGVPYCTTHGVMGPCPFGTQKGDAR